MENIDNYYMPKLSDLYVGFECEQFDYSIEKWLHHTVEDEGLLRLLNHLIMAKMTPEHEDWEQYFPYRVKYPNIQDIIDLGWIYKESEIGYESDIFIHSQCPDVYLFKYETKIHILNSTSILFDGNIRNKSELKVLMGWLELTPAEGILNNEQSNIVEV